MSSFFYLSFGCYAEVVFRLSGLTILAARSRPALWGYTLLITDRSAIGRGGVSSVDIECPQQINANLHPLANLDTKTYL
ncbi:hypothetical protein QUB68_01935 [Microcoleus sp. A006_D1]|uniref:hypothetical protein n=1 Tax=Microcoleus sp. A006_D1 TaxID=3055267 RepID=UPI002FD11106